MIGERVAILLSCDETIWQIVPQLNQRINFNIKKVYSLPSSPSLPFSLPSDFFFFFFFSMEELEWGVSFLVLVNALVVQGDSLQKRADGREIFFEHGLYDAINLLKVSGGRVSGEGRGWKGSYFTKTARVPR